VRETTWEFSEAWAGEDDVLSEARARASELGCVPVGRGGAAALRVLAAALGARAVVEVGTGTGVSGLALLQGMRPDGILTTVDIEPEHQRAAKEAFAAAGIAGNRARVISGRALDVLPRLADGGYDLVFCDGEKTEYSAYLAEALRLLRVGGAVAFDNTLWNDSVADPTQRDPQTTALRDLLAAVKSDDRLVAGLLPVGDGLLVAVKRA
jgi:predicted O-methyltransferase YrrM